MWYIPTELPRLRDRMADYAASEDGEWIIENLGGDWTSDRPEMLTAHADHKALTEGSLLHLAPSMVELLQQAKNGIGTTGFMDHDLPMMSGFAYFSKPLPADTSLASKLQSLLDPLPPDVREREMARISDEVLRAADATWLESLAVLWRHEPPSDQYRLGSVVLSWYVERDSWWEWVKQVYPLTGIPYGEREQFERVLYKLPPFVYDGHIIIGCSPDAASLSVERFDGAATSDHWRARRADLFRALCYLLRQRGVVDTMIVAPDRATRRRAAREGREAPEVRVLTLHGVSSGGGGGSGDREYRHRWMVRGHWRQQWYPSIQQHRPMWIIPHVKGPDGAPLLGGRRSTRPIPCGPTRSPR